MAKNIQNINETEDMNLEQLLMEYAEATENATEEAKTILEQAAKSSMLNEYLEEEDETVKESQVDEMDEKEQMDEAEGDDDDDMEEIDVDGDGDELETGDEDESEEDVEVDADETSLEDELEDDQEQEFNPLSDFEPDEDGNYDLTSVDDPQKIMDIIANAPDGAEVVIVKSATYDVEVNDDAGMSDEEEPFDGGDDMEDSFGEEDDMMDESNDMMQESEEEDEHLNEDVTRLLKIKDKKIKVYEQKMLKMQKALKQLHEQNKLLEENEVKYKKALNESKTYMQNLMLLNKNLAHTSKLFTEHATTKAEKQEILKEFNEVETIRESERMYSFFKRQLDKKTSNNSAKQAIIEEAKKVKKPSKIVKESVSFKKEKNEGNDSKSAFMRIANYKN